MPRSKPKITTSFDMEENPAIAEFIDQHSYDFADQATSSLLTRLRDVWDSYLKEGMDAGETVFELTDKVSNIFQGQDEREEWWRARRIARTESVGAANMGSLFGYEQAGVPYKQWVTQRDSKVRDSHEDMDGEIVPMDELFDVNGAKMEGPGDPAGGPEQIINCRCTVIPVFGEYKKDFEKGGEGSGHFDHAGRPGEVGGSTEGEGGEKEKPETGRRERALSSHVPATRESQQAGEANESRLAKVIKGKQQPDNKAFDVMVGGYALEIKSIIRGKNNKITMHPDSLRRKILEAKKLKIVPYTVVFDDRNNKIYYRKGVGSFRLSAMQEITMSKLKSIFK